MSTLGGHFHRRHLHKDSARERVDIIPDLAVKAADDRPPAYVFRRAAHTAVSTPTGPTGARGRDGRPGPLCRARAAARRAVMRSSGGHCGVTCAAAAPAPVHREQYRPPYAGCGDRRISMMTWLSPEAVAMRGQ
jgi:hypothetical protein